MTDRLVAHINRTGIHSLEVPDSFDTEGSFAVDLRNEGESTHVHLHLDDALSEVARLDAGNHYVAGDSNREVRVRVSPGGEPVRGKLKVVTAYGAETRYVDVSVGPERTGSVEVDPELSKPIGEAGGKSGAPGSAGSGPSDGGSEARLDVDLDAVVSVLPAVVFGLVAVILAAGAVLAPGGTDVTLALLAVVAGVLTAGYLLLQ
ncbi:MAG: hypothetical protein V5A62_09120 [Haloarculaceae archaeon]